MADIPDLDTAFSSSVNILGRVAHSDRADNVPMRKGVDLPGMPRDTRPHEGVIWERDWSLVPLSVDVERICPET